MRLLLAAISICLLSSCAGLADSIRKSQQKKQIYQQYSAKYYAACQKEAFSYYPVAIVTETKTKQNIIKPTKTASCTKWGNTVNCRDTTIDLSGLSGAGSTTTTSYDANAGARSNHLKSCIDSNLRNDSQFREAILVVENRYSAAKNNRSNKKKRKSKRKRTLQLSHSSDVTGELYCYYGESQEEYKPRTSFCPKEKNFFW